MSTGDPFAAHGRAHRLARDATAEWFDPPRFNLLRVLYEYAWASRERRDLLPHFRARALSALRRLRDPRSDMTAAATQSLHSAESLGNLDPHFVDAGKDVMSC